MGHNTDYCLYIVDCLKNSNKVIANPVKSYITQRDPAECEDARHRAIVSRAYFSAYLCIRKFAETVLQITLPPAGQSPETDMIKIRDYVKRSIQIETNEEARKIREGISLIASSFRELQQRRVLVDYFYDPIEWAHSYKHWSRKSYNDGREINDTVKSLAPIISGDCAPYKS